MTPQATLRARFSELAELMGLTLSGRRRARRGKKPPAIT
jgi:hypothetical protein